MGIGEAVFPSLFTGVSCLSDVKKSLESDYPRPEGVAFRPIDGFATAISKTLFRQSLMTLTTPKGRGFLDPTKQGCGKNGGSLTPVAIVIEAGCAGPKLAVA